MNAWSATDEEAQLVARAETVLGTGRDVPTEIEAFGRWWLEQTGSGPRVTWLRPGTAYDGNGTMYALLSSYRPSGPGGTSWERLSLVRYLYRHPDAGERVLTIPDQPELSRNLTDLLHRTVRAMKGLTP